MNSTHVAAAEGYVDAVLAGLIPVCRWVVRACERHRRDLKASADPAYPYWFDATKADRVCRFLEALPHTKGRWAAKQEPFVLQPWQAFFVCSIFGWVRKLDGLRRFRRALLFVPRKCGKSDLAARIGLYMLAADGEHGAEVFSGATTRDQAHEVFRPALLMTRATAAFRERFGVEPYRASIAVPGTGGRFEPVIGKPGDGSSPSCAIVDEYHEHDTDELAATMFTGMGAREQPLLLFTSTAGTNTAGPCFQLVAEAERVLDDLVQDEQFFALVYGLDADDDWTDPALLRKANPNYNVSVSEDHLLAAHRDAMQNARQQGSYQIKHLNRWVGARSAYFDLPKWMACRREIALDDFTGKRVILGLDLASTIDIAALTMLFRDNERYTTFSKFYLPEAAVEKVGAQHYQAWRREGRITVTDGEMIDFSFIREDLADLAQQFVIDMVAYDPHQATMLVTELVKDGLRCTEVRPTVLNFSQPMKQLDGLMRAGRIEHDGCPVMTWMVGNVVAFTDAKDNVYPRKQRDENKIDGVVALLMALAYDMAATPPPETSVYETRGLLTL